MSIQPTSTPIQSPLEGSSFFYQGRSAKYISAEQVNTTILPSLSTHVTDETEEGLLVGFELATNIAEVLLQVVVYGDNTTTPRAINNFTITDLRRLGRGITPGDSEKNPDGRSKDPMGSDNPLYPWIARFKDETLADDTGYTDKYYVVRFTPSVYVPYKRIVIDMTNTNPSETATIISLNVTRIVFEVKEDLSNKNHNLEPYLVKDEQEPPLPRGPTVESVYGTLAPVDMEHQDAHPDDTPVT